MESSQRSSPEIAIAFHSIYFVWSVHSFNKLHAAERVIQIVRILDPQVRPQYTWRSTGEDATRA